MHTHTHTHTKMSFVVHIYNTLEGTYFNVFKLSNNSAIAGCILLDNCLLIDHFIVLAM